MDNTKSPYTIKNPAYELLVYLNNQCPDEVWNDEIEMLFKNLKSNFLKAAGSVGLVMTIQEDSELISKSSLIKAQTIEYGFYKISTTWDIAFQIGKRLVPNLSNYRGKKFEFLEKEFRNHQNKLPHLNLAWFRSINQLRNKIVHGGLNLISFHDNSRLSFQAYNNQVDEIIPWSEFYCEEGRPIIFADRYFSFHVIFLHHLLVDYFKYLLFSISGKFELNEKIKDDLFGSYESSLKHWIVEDFCLIERMFNEISEASGEPVPFTMIQGESYFQ